VCPATAQADKIRRKSILCFIDSLSKWNGYVLRVIADFFNFGFKSSIGIRTLKFMQYSEESIADTLLVINHVFHLSPPELDRNDRCALDRINHAKFRPFG